MLWSAGARTAAARPATSPSTRRERRPSSPADARPTHCFESFKRTARLIHDVRCRRTRHRRGRSASAPRGCASPTRAARCIDRARRRGRTRAPTSSSPVVATTRARTPACSPSTTPSATSPMPASCAASSRRAAPGCSSCASHDNHHHLICSECGAVQDVDCAVGPAPCLTPVRRPRIRRAGRPRSRSGALLRRSRAPRRLRGS